MHIYLLRCFLKMIHNGSKHVGDIRFQKENLRTETVRMFLDMMLSFFITVTVSISTEHLERQRR